MVRYMKNILNIIRYDFISARGVVMDLVIVSVLMIAFAFYANVPFILVIVVIMFGTTCEKLAMVEYKNNYGKVYGVLPVGMREAIIGRFSLNFILTAAGVAAAILLNLLFTITRGAADIPVMDGFENMNITIGLDMVTACMTALSIIIFSVVNLVSTYLFDALKAQNVLGVIAVGLVGIVVLWYFISGASIDNMVAYINNVFWPFMYSNAAMSAVIMILLSAAFTVVGCMVTIHFKKRQEC